MKIKGEYKIQIEWEGPLTLAQVKKKNDAGEEPKWDGDDYGLYQIYGKHILYGKGPKKEALLYIGQAVQQTFSQRFKQHEEWIKEEGKDIKIYLGRLNASNCSSDRDNKSWGWYVKVAEAILIYKYMPCYNSSLKWEYPDVRFPFKSVQIRHDGRRRHLKKNDNAPRDYKKINK